MLTRSTQVNRTIYELLLGCKFRANAKPVLSPVFQTWVNRVESLRSFHATTFRGSPELAVETSSQAADSGTTPHATTTTQKWSGDHISIDKESHKPVYRYNSLLRDIARWKNFNPLVGICTNMVEDSVKPDVVTYNLLLSMYQPCGLNEECWELYHDMIRGGIQPDLETFHFLLKASSTASLRELVIELIEKHGLKPSSLTYEYYFEELAQNEELEHTIDLLEEMSNKSITPSLACYEKVIKLAGDFCECDLMLEILKTAEQNHHLIYPGIYTTTLRTCASNHHIDGVLYCWKKGVNESQVTIDQGLCIDILNVASRTGKTELAMDVINHLIKQGGRVEEQHFAALLESFLVVNDLKRAFSVIELTRTSGVEPTSRIAQPIYYAIRGDVNKIDNAYYILEELLQKGRKVDPTAFNVIILSCANATWDDEAREYRPDLQRMVETFKQAEKFGIEPNVETYQFVLQGCMVAKHPPLFQKFSQEMRDKNIAPNARIYVQMITMACMQVDYEDAFAYLEEMKSRNIVPPREAYQRIIKKCAFNRDPRAILAMEEMERFGYAASPELRYYVKTGQPRPNRNRFSERSKQNIVSSSERKEEMDLLKSAIESLSAIEDNNNNEGTFDDQIYDNNNVHEPVKQEKSDIE